MDQNKIKKENSYTYWVDNNTKYFEGVEKPDCKPKKLNETNNVDFNHKFGSKWNFAGVWEEKILENEEVLEFMNEFQSIKFPSINENIKFSKFENLDGEVSAVFSRGKTRLGFNINFEIPLETKGKVKVLEITDDGDFSMELLDFEDNNIAEILKKSEKLIEENIRTLLKYIVEYRS